MGAQLSATAVHKELTTEAPDAQALQGLLLEQNEAREGWVQVYGVLRHRVLSFYPSEEQFLRGDAPRNTVALANCAVSRFTGFQGDGVYPDGTIVIDAPGAGQDGAAPHRYAIQSFDADEVEQWLRALRLASREPWRSAPNCFLCDVPFDAWSRRHHCRRCGENVCGQCAPRFAALPNYQYDEEVRVCVGCYAEEGPVISAGERAQRKSKAEQEAEELRNRLRASEAARKRESGSLVVQQRRDRLRRMYGTEASSEASPAASPLTTQSATGP